MNINAEKHPFDQWMAIREGSTEPEMLSGASFKEKPQGVKLQEAEVPAEDLAVNEAQSGDNRLRRITVILRGVGAVLLLSAALVFAVQRIGDLGALGRYYTFFGFTCVLAAAGVFCVLHLKDPKGARTLLAISSAFLPALFVQLGAMLYAHTLSGPAPVPKLFLLIESNLSAVIAATLISFAILLPVAFAGFSALARVESKRLTVWYALFNSLLLIPERSPLVVVIIGLGMLASLVVLDFRNFSLQSAMKNKEGAISRSILCIPLLFFIARSILYPQTEVFGGLLCSAGAALIFIAAPRLAHRFETVKVWQAFSSGIACVAWYLLAKGLYFSTNQGLIYEVLGNYQTELFLPVMTLGMAAILALASCFTLCSGRRYRSLAVVIACGGALLQLFTIEGIGSSLFCVGVSTLALVSAFTLEEKEMFYASAAGLGLGLLYHLRYANDLYNISPWLSLALGGVCIVVLSSYLEGHCRQVVSRLAMFRKRVEGWR